MSTTEKSQKNDVKYVYLTLTSFLHWISTDTNINEKNPQPSPHLPAQN